MTFQPLGGYDMYVCDIMIGKNVQEALKRHCSRPEEDRPKYMLDSLTGVKVMQSDLIDPDGIIGCTEAGREVVKAVRRTLEEQGLI